MALYVVRAFVQMRKLLANHKELARELASLKQSVARLDSETQRQFDQVYEAILNLMPASSRKS